MSAVLLPWRRYAAYFRDRAARLLVGVIAIGTRGLMLALLAVFLRRMVDNAINAGTLTLVWREAVVAAIIASGCALGARRTITGVTKEVVSRIRDDLMAKNYRLPIDAAECAGRISMHTVIVQDTERLDRVTNAVLGVMLPAAVSVALLMGALLWVAPLFGSGCALVIALFWLGRRLTGSASRAKAEEFHKSFAAFSRSALAGVPNGAGKSTLFRLVLGLLRPQQGRLLADGVAYDELDLAAPRRQIGFAPPTLVRRLDQG
jgi:ABC-type transport system involved in cytochrome bd biosynthesis fused ATPase/permease subunit